MPLKKLRVKYTTATLLTTPKVIFIVDYQGIQDLDSLIIIRV
jgi:hypothetical protein